MEAAETARDTEMEPQLSVLGSHPKPPPTLALPALPPRPSFPLGPSCVWVSSCCTAPGSPALATRTPINCSWDALSQCTGLH